MTTKSFADLPDTIFCNIIEYLDWYEVGRFDNALLNRSMRNSYLVALKLRKVKVERNEFLKNRRMEKFILEGSSLCLCDILESSLCMEDSFWKKLLIKEY